MKTIVPVNRLPAISRTALRTAVSVVLALTALAGCDKASGLEFDDDTPQGMVVSAMEFHRSKTRRASEPWLTPMRSATPRSRHCSMSASNSPCSER